MAIAKILNVGTMQQAVNAFTRAQDDEREWVQQIAMVALDVLAEYDGVEETPAPQPAARAQTKRQPAQAAEKPVTQRANSAKAASKGRKRKAKIQCGCGKTMGENGFTYHQTWCTQAENAQPVS